MTVLKWSRQETDRPVRRLGLPLETVADDVKVEELDGRL
jgi:hypothetical protein